MAKYDFSLTFPEETDESGVPETVQNRGRETLVSSSPDRPDTSAPSSYSMSTHFPLGRPGPSKGVPEADRYYRNPNSPSK